MMPAPRLTDAQKLTITELRETEGWSYDRIAKQVGMSSGSVAWYCLKEAIESPNPRQLSDVPVVPVVVRRGGHQVRSFTQDEGVRLLELEATGMRIGAIARTLGRRWNSVRGRLMTLARRDERSVAQSAEGSGT